MVYALKYQNAVEDKTEERCMHRKKKENSDILFCGFVELVCKSIES